MLGGGSLQPKVNAFITQHHLEHAIRLVGRVQHDLLPAYFNEADLYVSSSYSDGTSISLLEAMACRLPVVVTDLPSNREWVTPGVNGWLVPAGDASTLSTAILEALADGDKARNMAKANLSIARNRADWNKNFNVLLEAYQRLAGDK
jgi:glycosyltransferase involved in cell wall biosynthesis